MQYADSGPKTLFCRNQVKCLNYLPSFCQRRIFSVSLQLSYCYTQKQLLLSAHLSYRNSVCPSVCLSHGWISQKRCKLGSPNLYR